MLSKEELLQVTGGDSFSMTAVIGGIVTFIMGALDGFLRPLKCER